MSSPEAMPIAKVPAIQSVVPAPHVPVPLPAARRVHTKIRRTSGWAALNLRETWTFRDLLFSLARRDLKLRYKQTALGVIWVVLQPLMAAGIFSFVFGSVAKLPSDGRPYFLFSFAGLLGWNLFSGTLTKTSTCLVGNAQLISKVFFPRLVLPLSSIPSAMIDFFVSLLMMVALMAIYHVPPTWAVLLLPVWMILLLMLAMGIGLYTAALAVTYRDVQYVLPVFMQILLYASPIAYSISAVPAHLKRFYMVNPLTGVLAAFRWSAIGTEPPPLAAIAYSAVVAVLVFAIGAFAFKRMERKFADVI